MDFKGLLNLAVEKGASDLHLQALAPPIMRIAGRLRSVDSAPLSNDDVLDFIASIAPKIERKEVPAALIDGLDFSHRVPGLCRFRCSGYAQLGNAGLMMRIIREQVPDFASLNLPDVVRDIALSRRGLTLVTGTTGSGKSTTLASMIDLVNNQYAVKIITIEDPVEYVHTRKKALVAQLEVGIDTPSVDAYSDTAMVSHRRLVERGLTWIEGLDLSAVRPGLYRLVALPLPLVGAEAAPLRAVLEPLPPNEGGDR